MYNSEAKNWSSNIKEKALDKLEIALKEIPKIVIAPNEGSSSESNSESSVGNEERP